MSDFGQKMSDILNYGALNLAMAIGYKKRLFDVMEDLGAMATAAEIADSAGVNLRYIQEWLGVMVTGGIVEIETDSDGIDQANPTEQANASHPSNVREVRYHLPQAHAAFLTRQAGSSNLGVYTQEIPLLTQCAMAAVEKGFDTGEGVPFSVYPQFQSFMSELSNAKHREVLVEKFLPGVDGGKLIQRLEAGIRVCDLGCGEGVALNLMAERFPKSEFVGIDNHAEAIETAKKEAAEKGQMESRNDPRPHRDGGRGLKNVTYRVEDAATLMKNPDFAGQFDFIMAFDAIHDQTRPLAALKSIKHMLAEGGIFSMVDIDAGSRHSDNMAHPMGPFLYTVSLMHCMPVGLGASGENGMGLGMMWGRQRAVALLKEAGFDHIETLEMAHDPFNVHYQCQ